MKNKFSLFYVMFLLLFAHDSFAQKEAVKAFDKRQTLPDTTIERNSLEDNNDSLQKWKQSREFGYMNYLDSLLRKRTDMKADTVTLDGATGKVNRQERKTGNFSGLNKWLNNFPLKVFFWILAIFFIAFIFYKVFIKNGLFNKTNNQSAEKEIEEPDIGLSEMLKYDSWIDEAETKKDFNLATRYWYLKTLRNLSDKEMISFSADKTNNEYVQEMATSACQPQFLAITHMYEYAWYGKFLIDKIKYQQLKEAFILFNKKI